MRGNKNLKAARKSGLLMYRRFVILHKVVENTTRYDRLNWICLFK